MPRLPARRHGRKLMKRAQGVGYPTSCDRILHPILHPKSLENTTGFAYGCRKCRRFSKTFFHNFPIGEPCPPYLPGNCLKMRHQPPPTARPPLLRITMPRMSGGTRSDKSAASAPQGGTDAAPAMVQGKSVAQGIRHSPEINHSAISMAKV